MSDKPMAMAGLTSYRYHGRWGYVMIGANSIAEALREAARSIEGEPNIQCLQVWNVDHYQNVEP